MSDRTRTNVRIKRIEYTIQKFGGEISRVLVFYEVSWTEVRPDHIDNDCALAYSNPATALLKAAEINGGEVVGVEIDDDVQEALQQWDAQASEV